MPRRLLFLINVTIVMVLLAGTGAQWLLLQSVAWTNMLVAFSQEGSLTEALEKTFDGKNPCSLCSHIAEAEKSPASDDGTLPSGGSHNLHGVLAPVLAAMPPSWTPLCYPSTRDDALSRSFRPSVPPPRTGALS